MPQLPPELVNELDETTVVGDIDAFVAYIESGQALQDWYERLTMLAAEYDAFLKEHSNIWSHIIIQRNRPSRWAA
jgi:hypothetical protein